MKYFIFLFFNLFQILSFNIDKIYAIHLVLIAVIMMPLHSNNIYLVLYYCNFLFKFLKIKNIFIYYKIFKNFTNIIVYKVFVMLRMHYHL